MARTVQTLREPISRKIFLTPARALAQIRALPGAPGRASESIMDTVIYRIAAPDALAAAAASGAYEGEAFDRADGFIHCSARAQIAETLTVHYGQATRLAVAEIDASALGELVKWERSRGGEAFPHVYGAIPWSAVAAVHLITRDESGAWRLPEELCP